MISDNSQPEYSVLDLGFNKSLTKNLLSSSLIETTPEMRNAFSSGIASASLISGELLGNQTVKEGYIQSDNYVTGTSGWRLSPTTADLSVVTSVLSLDIPNATTANSFHVDTSGNAWWGATTFAAAVASVSKAGAGIFT